MPAQLSPSTATNAIPVALGGTGAVTAAAALANLGAPAAASPQVTGTMQFDSSTVAKVNLFGTAYGFGVQPSEYTMFSGGAWAFRAGGYGGSVVASITAVGIGIFSTVSLGATGPTWTTGTAVPASTAPVGSLYSRVGGAVGATLYVSRGSGTWAAVSGV